MKIALPTRDNVVDEHFGHCEAFTIFNVEDNKIESSESMPSLSGCGCKSGVAPLLAKKGVTILLGGNMGQGAVNVLQQNGIHVIRGCSGQVSDVIEKYLAGEIKDQEIICDHHNCGSH